jgi:hypothetical protein
MANRIRKYLSTEPLLYQATLDHLIWMAKQPAAKEYAWHRAKELDADIECLWVGIKDDLVKHMKDLSK